MRNLLALVGALVVGFGGLGWYLGWYKLSVAKSSDGNLQIKTDVDTTKVVNDTNEGLKKVGSVIGDQLDKAGRDAKPNQPGSPAATPGPINPPRGGAGTDDGWFGPLVPSNPKK